MAVAQSFQLVAQATRSLAPVRPTRSKMAVQCSAQNVPTNSRRQALQQLAILTAATTLPLPAMAAKGAKGFVPVNDQQDAYTFLYPFGWQEVQVDGQDSVYKDVIEPLESVSVNLTPTDKKDITEFGDAKEVAFTLADKVLTGPAQEVNLMNVAERVTDGRKYIDFEFLAKSKGYTRHALASVTIGNGKLYTLVTGSNERRWNKMSDKIKTIVKTFQVSDRY